MQPVSSLWLEFDSTPEAADLPTPLLCARLEGSCEPDWLVGTLLPAMQGAPLGGAQRRNLLRCLAALPPRAHVLYAFSLLGRSEGGVRLELYGLGPAAMAGYLRPVVSTAAAERVESVVHLVAGADRFHLSFDVGEKISPRIGVECGLRRQPRREPRWAELLDRLVAHGLASRAKVDALLTWPGQDSLWTAPDRWSEAAVSLGGHGVRCLSHLKLVLHPDRPPEAKTYLLFQHLPGRASVAHARRLNRRR